jgi:hypothetical protein
MVLIDVQQRQALLTQKRFVDRSKHDFSTLPPELLQIIMHHGARTKHGTSLISPALFKARLVSKIVSREALATFYLLLKLDPNYRERYSVLHLPPRSGDFYGLVNAVKKDPRMFHAVTSLQYHVMSAPGVDSAQHLVKREHYDHPVSSSCTCASSWTCADEKMLDTCSSQLLLEQNLKTFERQLGRQNNFVDNISSVAGLDAFGALLSGLCNLISLCLKVQDFWSVKSMYQGQCKQADIAEPVWSTALPQLLRQLAVSSHVTMLKLDRIDSAALAVLQPTVMLEQHRTFWENITDLDLVMTHRGEMNWKDGSMPGPTHERLRGAEHMHVLLSSTENLVRLRLGGSYLVPFIDAYEIDHRWLEEAMGGLMFSSLESFELADAEIYAAALLSFLVRHKKTLRRVALSQVNTYFPGAWLHLLEEMRAHLSLVDATVEVHKNEPGGIQDIIKTFGVCIEKDAANDDRWNVDVGLYLVHSRGESLQNTR